MRRRKGFTLVELMVVILIVGILAAVAIPLMQGRINKAKWSEANAAAGTIRTAVRAYVAETSLASANTSIPANTPVSTVLGLLGFSANDLEGTYFTATDYTITSIDANGNAAISVTASKTNAPSGTATLSTAGVWTTP